MNHAPQRADRAATRHVVLLVETSVEYGRQILRGIARYLRTHRGWSVFLEERELDAPPPDWLQEWAGDGIICRPTTRALADSFRRRNIPFVDLSDRYSELGQPHLESDMEAIGRLGAEHLLERGFRNLAFCGFSNELWAARRRRGFEEVAARRGRLHPAHESSWLGLRDHPWQEERDRIRRWLETLPRPLGVMACNDVRGQHVLDACRQLGAAVPDDIAVIGVDNAETFCELCDPPLSSVIPDAERLGFAAAERLDRLMAGETPPPARPFPPLGVATRQSSDGLAIADRVVARAVRLIRDHACQGLRVADLLRQLPYSRPVLERRFRSCLQRSPQQEIHRVRLARARQLLAETDWPLKRVAEAAGFAHPEYFNVFVKRETGLTPRGLRNRLAISRDAPMVPVP
ncbi:MAG: DNA-binding transcriptional regulator [Lentisphaeria bacterium]